LFVIFSLYFIQFTNLTKLLDKLSVINDFDKIDVDEIRKKASLYNHMEIYEAIKIDDDNYERILTNDLNVFILNNILKV